MSKYIGDVSAYAYAVSKGYTGTEEEFAELMASYANVGQTAVDAKDAAVAAKTAAQTAANTATTKASEATTAATTATTKAGEASTSASTATSAKDTAVSASQTATTKATEATTAAATAASAKTDAVAANTAAQSAKTAAQTAQTGAETAAASVSASAEQIATNAEDISQLKSEKADTADLLKAFPTDTASGAVASFDDGANLPVKSLVVNIEPVQDLHGQDAPYPAGGGKNLFEVTATSQTINGVTFTVNDDETVTANGIATANTFFELITSNISFTESTILNGCPSGGGGTTYAIQLNAATLEVGSGITIAANTTITSVRIRIASGVTLNNVVFKPMIRLATETDDTFAPYENICPISGWSEVNVGVSGKNLFNSNFPDYTKPYNYYICPIKLENGKRYKLKAELVGTTITGASFGLVKSGNRYEEFVGPYYVIGANGDVRDFSITIDDTFTAPKLIAYVSGENQFNEVLSNYNVMLMPYEQADYEPYSGTSVTIDLGQTVYGGTLDVVSGELVIDRKYIKYDGSADETWYTYASTGYRLPMSDIAPSGNGICNLASTVSSASSYGVMFSASANYIYFFQAVSEWGVETVPDLRTWLASNNVEVCYELATPITVQLTPHEVTALLGSNNVWADTGDSEVVYRADPTLYIQRFTEPDADMVADANITSGQYFMVGTTLYKATANIASGGAITPNVNCTRKSLSEALNELNV